MAAQIDEKELYNTLESEFTSDLNPYADIMKDLTEKDIIVVTEYVYEKLKELKAPDLMFNTVQMHLDNVLGGSLPTNEYVKKRIPTLYDEYKSAKESLEATPFGTDYNLDGTVGTGVTKRQLEKIIMYLKYAADPDLAQDNLEGKPFRETRKNSRSPYRHLKRRNKNMIVDQDRIEVKCKNHRPKLIENDPGGTKYHVSKLMRERLKINDEIQSKIQECKKKIKISLKQPGVLNESKIPKGIRYKCISETLDVVGEKYFRLMKTRLTNPTTKIGRMTDNIFEGKILSMIYHTLRRCLTRVCISLNEACFIIKARRKKRAAKKVTKT